MKNLVRLALALLLPVLTLPALTAQSLLDMRVDLVYLASDYLEGREAGKIGEDRAGEYLIERFKEIGLSPLGDEGSYEQSFEFNYTANPHASSGEARMGENIIGYVDRGAATTVIIGAHYDHIGRGAFGSRFLDGPIIHNGADDNASGVAALLYLAEKVVKSDLKGHNFLFIAFSGEEMGLYGSKHFVKYPTLNLEQVSCMLNMDMVGRLEEQSLLISGAGTSPLWKSLFPEIKNPALKITTTDSGVGPSDHTSFYLSDLPALHFFTGTHEDYHKPSDDSPKINFKGIKQVADWMYELVVLIDDKGKLEFSKTKDESQRQASSFKVTLGIMPDYSFSGTGMRIDAVLDDRPAQKAGLEDGDVLIQIGELEVKDIYEYMDGLSKFEVGQAATVKVKRGEKVVEHNVVF